jgi:hypothetical protein
LILVPFIITSGGSLLVWQALVPFLTTRATTVYWVCGLLVPTAVVYWFDGLLVQFLTTSGGSLLIWRAFYRVMDLQHLCCHLYLQLGKEIAALKYK